MLRLLLPLAALAALLRAAVSARLASPSARATRGQRGPALRGAGAAVAEGGLAGASCRRLEEGASPRSFFTPRAIQGS